MKKTLATLNFWKYILMISIVFSLFYRPAYAYTQANNTAIEKAFIANNGATILVTRDSVFLGPDFKADVANVIAATTHIQDNDFFVNKLHAQPCSIHGVATHQGMITAKEAGLEGFVAPCVENSSTIPVTLRKVPSTKEGDFTLDLAGDRLLEIAITKDLQQQIINNSSDNNTVITAVEARNIVNNLINSSGIVNANKLEQEGEDFVLSVDATSHAL